MKFDYTARVRAGIILIILSALYSNWLMLLAWFQLDLSFVGNDAISQYERRFDEVRKVLPPYGTIGYRGDPLNNADGSPNSVALRNRYLAQYYLAPLVLSESPGQSIYLFNMNSGDSKDTGKEARPVIDLGSGNRLHDFGDGIKLLIIEPQ